MARALPTGTVTFLFSDVEGSTRLLRELGSDAYARALMEHRRVLREAFAAHGGVEVDTQGDAFLVAFPTAPGALAAAQAAQHALEAGPIRVRMGIHTGTPHLSDEGYIGEDVHRGARIAAAGHGGQVLVSSTTAALAGTAGLSDLGEHRLKDLSAPERIYQQGDARFPPPRSLHQTNLPIAPTPFLGRERELAELVALLERDDVRLVTLTGPGGTGKTRLAMQAAAELSDRYPHGVWWVPLEALSRPELVLGSAAQAVGAKGDLAEFIGDRKMLVVFDNFEQVVAAAPGIAALVAACPALDLLVTSREPLRIRGEREYPVPPLAHDEGVRLFVERARELGKEVSPDRDVAEICRRLDELPLAIELAVARVRMLAPAQMLRRLEQRLPLLTGGARDLPERQRTLRGAIEWSHELLSAEEQRLFARLAVFRGGWTLEAAEAVAEADLETLQSLVEKSLVRESGGRSAMLQTIREYAAERLAASGEADDLARRHTEYFADLAASREQALLGGDPGEVLDELESEHDNLRAALDRLEAAGEGERAMRMVGSLLEFWCMRGRAHEGWRRAEALLKAHPAASPGRGRALSVAVHLGPAVGVPEEESRRRSHEAIEVNGARGQEWDVAHATHQLAGSFVESGEPARAVPLLEEAVARYRALGYAHSELQATRALAWAHLQLGDKTRYREMHEQILERAVEADDKRMQATVLGALAWVATDQGRYVAALAALERAYPLEREIGDPAAMGLVLTRLALLFARWDRPEVAAVLLARAEAIREELNEADPGWVAEFKQTAGDLVRVSLDARALAEATERGRSMSSQEAFALAFAERPERL